MGKWMRTNGPALLMLTFAVLLALFVRSYFAYETSAENDYIVSGGSDSYYWRRIIDYHIDTGLNLFKDPLLNYPDNLVNPRPPMYSMSVAIPAVLAQGLFDSVSDSAGFFLVWSTAFWGALTVVPVYFLGREVFGRRVGMTAAFLFALMPAHIQRTVLSNADHDALILFLIVTTFFFLLRAIRVQEHRRWVESWRSRASVVSGLKAYFAGSRTAVLYALMAGAAYAALMMTWVGFAYVTVIILVYYIVELFFNMFRGQDSTSVTMVILVAMGFGYLLAFPYYANYIDSFFNDRFLVPVLLTAGALFFGIMFVVSRDVPWTLSLPAIVGVTAGIVGVISLFYPWLGEAIMTGQGYFSQSKLYTTIAEARAPQFSELALSFGMVTFFLSLAGLMYALMRVPKRTGAAYVFMVVWLAASIFMAISASRFMINASPAFAISAAWVFVIIVDGLDFNSVRKAMAGASGSLFGTIRKSVKVRHVVGVLFLGFMILLPNVWYSVDAGIPSETKRAYDKEIYFSMPSFMRPGGYDEYNGSNWYLGAFGYSLPLPTYYYPAAWDWFSEQDSDIYPMSSRPAYVAWWDYGFEAVADGDHPTVADNFQNGYQFTGNAIMAQSEDDAVALFAFRLIQGAYRIGGAAEEGVVQAMDAYGVDPDRMQEIIEGPGQPVIDEVLSDPDVYGPMSPDLTEANARIVAGRVEIEKAGADSVVGLYDRVCEVTGWEIRYFNVDSRLFPTSAYQTGIFYAPAKLSDRRIDGSTPVDFFTIKAVDSNGIAYDLDEVTADMVIYSYEIEYTDMFYDSMFYRAMCGFSGTDIGAANDGLPGVSGSVQKNAPMPGWNMTHFRAVYRTAYYNPWPSGQVALHSADWRAVSYEEALELYEQITAGEIEGVVDYSASSLYNSGTVFLKYYHGAYVNGTVTTEEGYPAEGLWVTVQDEYGIPHQQVRTDALGRYSLLAPFGEVTVIISDGSAVNPGLTGSNIVARMEFNVTDDQAMRVRQDLDGDGVLDYIITKDHVMKASRVYGDVFWDVDGEGNYTADTDILMEDVEVYAVDTATGATFEFDAPEGSYDGNVSPGQYDIYAIVMGANLTVAEAENISAGEKANLDLAVEPARLGGYLLNPDGSPAAGVELVLDDLASDAEFSAVTAGDGAYSFGMLLGSRYVMTTTEDGKTVFDERFSFETVPASTRNVTLWDACTVSVRVTVDGAPAPYAAYALTDDFDPLSSLSGLTDGYGWVRLEVPAGRYTLQAVHATGSGPYSGAMVVDLRESASVTGALPVHEAFKVTGGLKAPSGSVLKSEDIAFVCATGARVVAKSDNLGGFDVLLPQGVYGVVVNSHTGSGVYGGELSVDGDRTGLVITLSQGVRISGTLYKDADGDAEPSPVEKAPFGGISVTDADGYVHTAKSYEDGSFSVVFPKGEEVTVSLADPGFSSWSQELLYASDIEDTAFVALSDAVEVTGLLTSDGAGITGVTISFVPDPTTGLATVEAASGASGRYSAMLIPGPYTVVVDQELTNTPGAWWQHESTFTLEPSGSAFELDIGAVLRVQVQGSVLGAAQDISIEFSGPEELSVDPIALSYSVFLMPGEYSVYATGRIGTTPYASMGTMEASAADPDHDIHLERAYDVSGIISIGDTVATKVVTVTATSSEGIQAVNQSTRYGDYSLALPPGEYALLFLLEDIEHAGDTSMYVERWSEQLIVVGTDDVALDPSLSTRLDNTTVSGTVVDEDGDPITASIEVFPNSRYGMYASFQTDSSGVFSAQVQPGDYTVYVSRSVDRRVSISYLPVPRNEGATAAVQLSVGEYLEGRLTVAGAPATEEVIAVTNNTRLSFVPSGDGYFQFLLPSGDYTVSSSAVRTEGGMSVTYGRTADIALGGDSVYIDLALTRDTERSVEARWDENRTATLAPGQSVSYVVELVNTGNIADTYTFTYTNTGFDLAFSPEEVAIDFGTNGDTAYMVAEVTVGSAAEAGNNTITVTVRSGSQSSARATVDLKVVVSPVYSVSVEAANASSPTGSNVTTSKFLLNNTGNIGDEYLLSVSNSDALNASGWSARVVDPATGEEVKNITLAAFGSKELAVEFTATSLTADPKAVAVVHARSSLGSGADALGAVQVLLPDIVIGPGGLDVTRGDVTYEYDIGRIYLDVGLAASLAALVVAFFVLRRRKGFGRGGPK
ncbi:MAG: carboxypeptidase regulatory-like domain-containing protein [Candidatus Thermoplasmatota archaeon]